MKKNISYLLMVLTLVNFFATNVLAADMANICQNAAEVYSGQQFKEKYRAPKVWIDWVNIENTQNYPNYSFEMRISGQVNDSWIHEVWSIKTISARGGCGVIEAKLLNVSMDN